MRNEYNFKSVNLASRITNGIARTAKDTCTVIANEVFFVTFGKQDIFYKKQVA
jgi:hypothetical protein